MGRQCYYNMATIKNNSTLPLIRTVVMAIRVVQMYQKKKPVCVNTAADFMAEL